MSSGGSLKYLKKIYRSLSLITFILMTSYLLEGYAYAQQSRDFLELVDGECDSIQPKNTANKKIKNIAFIIGNGSYHPSIGWLDNPVNDAKAMASLSVSLGFTTYVLIDAKKGDIRNCLNKIKAKHSYAEKSLFYYSGHGLQKNNQNFLIPVGLNSVEEARSKSIPVTPIINELRTMADISVILFDACRNNTVGDLKGLALSETIETKTSVDSSRLNQFVYGFATQPGNIADEGEGELSPFAKALLEHLGESGKSILENLVDVTNYVGKQTKWRQVPFIRSSLSEQVFLSSARSWDEIKQASEALTLRATNAFNKGEGVEAIKLSLMAIPKNTSSEKLKLEFFGALNSLRAAMHIKSASLDLPVGRVKSVYFSNDSRYVFVIMELEEGVHYFSFWDQNRSVLIWSKEDISYKEFAFSANGRVFVIENEDNLLEIRESETGNLISIIESNLFANAAIFSSPFRDDYDISMLLRFNLNSYKHAQVKLSPTGDKLLIYDKKSIEVIAIKDKEIIFSLGMRDEHDNVASYFKFRFMNNYSLCFMTYYDAKNEYKPNLEIGVYSFVNSEKEVWHSEIPQYPVALGYFTCHQNGSAIFFNTIESYGIASKAEKMVSSSSSYQERYKQLFGDWNAINRRPLFGKNSSKLLLSGDYGSTKVVNYPDLTLERELSPFDAEKASLNSFVVNKAGEQVWIDVLTTSNGDFINSVNVDPKILIQEAKLLLGEKLSTEVENIRLDP